MRRVYPVLIMFIVFALFLPGPGQAGEQSSSGVKSLHFITEDGRSVSSGEVVTLLPGEPFSLQARAFFEDGTEIIANSGADWSSSDSGVMAVPGGSFNYDFIQLKAGSEGSAVVTANFKGKTASVRITVSPVVSLDVSLDKNTSYKNAVMENGRVIMEKGSATSIYVTATLADGTKKEANRLTRFELKNPEIVLIGYGSYPAVRYNQLIALKEDNTEVTLTLNGVTNSLGVTVIPRKKIVPDQNPDAVVSFNDPGLESAVRAALNIPAGEITAADMAKLTEFSCMTGDITGLEYATNLKKLTLPTNSQLRDISAIAGMTQLRELSIIPAAAGGWGDLSDISPLAGLTGLERLELFGNFEDISALANLVNLRELNLSSRRIGDISALAGLNKLQSLSIRGDFADLSPLARLTNLQSLQLFSCRVGDISPLGALVSLKWLSLNGKQISDLTPLGKLANLEGLSVYEAQVGDVSSLGGLKKLTSLDLRANKITSVSSLKNLNSLGHLDLSNNLIQDISPLIGLEGLYQLVINDNLLDLGTASGAISDIERLVGRGVAVVYEPQKTEQQLEVKTIYMAIPDAIHSVLTPIFPGDTVSVRPGGYLYLSPRAVYSNGEHGEIPDPAWTTSDPEVAGAGNNSIKGIKEGTIKVTVAYRWHTTSFKVQVSPVVSLEVSALSPSMVTENGAMTMYGGDGKIVLNAVLDNGVRENVTRFAQWKSKDPEVVTVVESGIDPAVTLYSRKEGEARFTATFGGMTTGFTVKSRPYPPAPNSTPDYPKISVKIKGVLQDYDQPPVIISGRTYVPLRGIFEALGAKVDWNEKLKTITATRDGAVTIRLTVDSVIAFINGRHTTMDQPPVLINNRTMVPVRFVSKAMRYRVDWDEGSRTVLISEILIGPASGPSADEAKIYILKEGLLKKVTDVQITPIRFVEYGDKNAMVTGTDETGREKIFWLAKNKYTGKVSVTGTVFTGDGISRETLCSVLYNRGFRPENIKKTYIAPYEPQKICWYVNAKKDNKMHYYCFDYYSGEVYAKI